MNIKKFLGAFICCIISVSAIPVNAEAADKKAYGNACLIGEIGSESNWGTAEDSIKIDGDAKYEYTWNAKGDIDYLALSITPAEKTYNFNSITFPNLDISIDEIWIDGNKFDDYEMNPNSVDLNYFENGAGISRIYLMNGNTPASINDLGDNKSISKSIRVVFTVSGLGEDGNSNYVHVEEPSTEQVTVPVQTAAPVKTASSVTTLLSATTTTVSTPVPDIAESAPTGDNGVKSAAAFLALSGAAIILSKSRKK